MVEFAVEFAISSQSLHYFLFPDSIFEYRCYSRKVFAGTSSWSSKKGHFNVRGVDIFDLLNLDPYTVVESWQQLGSYHMLCCAFGFWSRAAISLAPVCISQGCTTEDYGKQNGTTFTIVSTTYWHVGGDVSNCGDHPGKKWRRELTPSEETTMYNAKSMGIYWSPCPNPYCLRL